MTARSEVRIGRLEFVALIAMMFATIAFSIDAMLPALPAIASEIAPNAMNSAPLILTAFVFGMGLGTFFTGPLSDAYGRRPVVFCGAFLYILSAGAAWLSQSLEVMLIARVFQGLGAAGPRIVAIAIVRDLYSGRQMAQIVSIVMLIFTLVPAFAPAMGDILIRLFDWRAIFLAFMIFSGISVLWFALRLTETLPVDQRRPLQLGLLAEALFEIFSIRTVRTAIFVQTLAMAMLFVTLMLIQPIYAQVFDRAASFPYWTGAIALISGSASIINALLVVRYGMRRLITFAFAAQVFLSAMFFGLNLGAGQYGFYFFLVWQTCLFFQAGLTLGNLNALAMEPLGHIAGMAASVIGSVSTVLAALIASPIGLMFDGTTQILPLAVLILSVLALWLMIRLRRHEVVFRHREFPRPRY